MYYYQGYDPNVIKVCPVRLRLIHCNGYKNVSFQLCVSGKDSVKLVQALVFSFKFYEFLKADCCRLISPTFTCDLFYAYNNLIRWLNPNDTPEHFKSRHNRSNLKTFTPFGRLISAAVQPVTSEPQPRHQVIFTTVEIKPQIDHDDSFTSAITSNCHFLNFHTKE